MQSLSSRLTIIGTEAEREAFNLTTISPATEYRWIVPGGDEYYSAGNAWQKTKIGGAGRSMQVLASGKSVADDPHSLIHQGRMFNAGHIASSINNDASLNLIITTPSDDWPHLSAHISLDGSAEIYIYESPVFVGGSSMTVTNFNRLSSNTFGGTVVHTPSEVSNDGTLIMSRFSPGGTGPHSGGTSNGFDKEIVAKAGTSYLFRMTNRSGQSKRGGILLVFYSAPAITGE